MMNGGMEVAEQLDWPGERSEWSDGQDDSNEGKSWQFFHYQTDGNI